MWKPSLTPSAVECASTNLEHCVITLASIVKDFPDDVKTSPLDPTLFRLGVAMLAMGDTSRATRYCCGCSS